MLYGTFEDYQVFSLTLCGLAPMNEIGPEISIMHLQTNMFIHITGPSCLISPLLNTKAQLYETFEDH